MSNHFQSPTGRYTAEQSRRLSQAILSLAKSGMRTGEIAEKLGAPYSRVADRIYEMRLRGDLPVFKILNPHRAAIAAIKRTGKSLGTMASVYQALGADAAEWVATNTPKGGTAAEFIASIIRDAYFEEKETAE